MRKLLLNSCFVLVINNSISASFSEHPFYTSQYMGVFILGEVIQAFALQASRGQQVVVALTIV